MTIVGCPKTKCSYNREAISVCEKEVAPQVCGKDYIIKGSREGCEDFEMEELEEMDETEED